MKKSLVLCMLLHASLVANSQWHQAANIPTQNFLASVMFSDPDHGWIAGYQGTVLRTTDAGNNWELLETGTTADLLKIFFADNLHGWVLSDSLILATADGGETWSEQYATELILSDLHFTDSQNGWVTAWYNKLLHTTDGGNSWELISMPDLAMPNSIQFLDPQTAYLGGTDYSSGFWLKLYKSTDGGENWTLVANSGTDMYLNRLFFIDELNGWITGYYHMEGIHLHDTSGYIVQHTQTGGSTWETGYDKENQSVRSLWFTTPQAGWAVAGNGVFLGSTDGGASWTEELLPPFRYLADVTFSSTQDGWAVGDSGTVMHTDNNGALAVPDHSTFDDDLLSIYPNPSADLATVEVNLPVAGDIKLILYNIYCQQVMEFYRENSFPGENIFRINIASLPRGIYFCEIKSPGIQQRCFGKIVRN